ncbi:MAG TPA: hypothetical protein VKR22_12285, partial [Acidimicrobiales bacterium]|nr:hypothetical protein [Acidimicrobiales bacterium]
PVAAFANLRAATKDGGRLAMVCWQAMIENEWLFVPGAAVMEIVPLPDLGPPDGPGMFALADADRVTGLLTKAGWSDVTLTSMRTPMLIGGGGTMEDTLEFLRTGAIGRTMMQNADEATKERALEALRAALTPFLVAEGVKMSSAAWVVQANA